MLSPPVPTLQERGREGERERGREGEEGERNNEVEGQMRRGGGKKQEEKYMKNHIYMYMYMYKHYK